MSLVEVVASIVLLAALLPSIAYLFVFSQKIMRSNQMRSEAIQVSEDIKQHFDYRSQTQDFADLNRISIVELNEKAKEDEQVKMRAEHLIIDNTGIAYDAKHQSVYDEIPIIEKDDNRGDFIRLVNYEKDEPLPDSLKTLENNKYMGYYLNWNTETQEYENTDFLVRIDVLSQEDKIEEGLNLELGVWDKTTGSQLHSTVFKWIIKY